MYYDCYHRSLSLIQLKQLFNPMYVTFIKLKHFHFCTTHYHHSSASSTTSLPNNNSAAHHLFASMLINISQRFSLIACLYVIHFNLFKSHQTMAENKNEVSLVGFVHSVYWMCLPFLDSPSSGRMYSTN